MAEIKISDLTPKGANLIATDLLVISEDIGGGLYETKSITGDEVLNAVAKTAVAVRNTTGATIYKGTIVYISGTSGGKALISKAKADAEITSSKTLGVVTADIANNANGNVLTNGLLTLLDTRTTATNPFTADTLVIGDDLYLSPTTAGYVTNVKPIAPNNLVSIGKVLETSATTGQILYAIVNGYELGELHDVDTTGAVSGDVLALNGGIWKPTTISSGLTIGTTPITSGTDTRILFQQSGVVQQDSNFTYDSTLKRLALKSVGALITDIPFRVRNSSDTADIFKIQGNNEVNVRANLSLGLYPAGATRKFYMVRDAETVGIDLDWAGASTIGARIVNGGTGSNIALTVNSFNGTSNFAISIANGDISMSGAVGTKIGVSTTQKFAFWNATPIVQPTTAITAATFVTNTSLIANDTATFDGYTIGQVVKALKNLGILA